MNVYMPRKDEPILTIRLSEGLDRQLQALAALRAVRKSTAARMLMSEAVEQALGSEPRVEAEAPAGEARAASTARRAVGSTPTVPAPAEPSKGEPSWKTSLMTSGERSNIGARPKK